MVPELRCSTSGARILEVFRWLRGVGRKRKGLQGRRGRGTQGARLRWSVQYDRCMLRMHRGANTRSARQLLFRNGVKFVGGCLCGTLSRNVARPKLWRGHSRHAICHASRIWSFSEGFCALLWSTTATKTTLKPFAFCLAIVRNTMTQALKLSL